MKILGQELKKVEFKTVKPEDIPKIKVPKFTIEDFMKYQIEVIKRANEEIEKQERLLNEDFRKT